MSNIFQKGTKVDIPEVLNNRDKRVAIQERLVNEKPTKTIIGAKLNIPGPIKNNAEIKRFYLQEMGIFEQKLKDEFSFKLFLLELDQSTGPESFYIVDGSSKDVKKACVKFEESKDYRRLFDLDVHNLGQKDLSRTDLGFPERKCLICGKPAKECGRARTHSVADLQAKVSELISEELLKHKDSVNF